MSLQTTFSLPCLYSYLQQASKILYDSALDSISYSGACLVAAVAAKFFLPFLAPPLAITAVSIYFANTTIKLLQESQNPIAKKLNAKFVEIVNSLEKQIPYIQLIVFVSALALSFISLIAASVLIITTSLFTAVKIGIQKNKDFNSVPISVILSEKNNLCSL